MEFPSEVKPALWGAAGGAILLAIVGFTWGGWMTTSAANKLADQRADVAVVAILTPICVEKFHQNGDAIANLTALKKISSSWEQGNFVEKGGWQPVREPAPPITFWRGHVRKSWSKPKVRRCSNHVPISTVVCPGRACPGQPRLACIPVRSWA